MATIWWEQAIAAPAAETWAALRRFDKAHENFAPVLSACTAEGADVRSVTFGDGTVVRERLVTLDDERRRIVYTVLDRFQHHASAIQIIPVDESSSRFIWITDVLPDAAAERVQVLTEHGARAFAGNMASGKLSG